MGDPKFSRKRYDTPSHPWQGERISLENELLRKYGLKNKKELWKMESLLRTFRQRARDLQAKVRIGDEQAEKERDELIKRLDNLALVSEDASLDDVLTLDLESLLNRRLQTVAYLKGLSNSSKQARQFIVHGHVSIDGRKVTIPGYLVKRIEEESINYLGHSPLSDDLHPARPRDELDTEEQAPQPKEPTGPSEGVDPSKPAAESAEKPSEDKLAEEPKADEGAAEKPLEGPEKAEPEAEKTAEEPPKDEKKPEAEKPKEPEAAEKPAEKPAEEPKAEPVEEPKKEEKPAEKPEEPKEGDA